MDLFVKETGEENKESIVFIHGGGFSGWMWDKQLEEFTDYHCLVPDLPEHGKSMDVGPFTMETAAEQIIELIKEINHDKKAHLVGLSLSGQLIVQILGMAPEVVDHAVISGTVVRKYYGKNTLKAVILIWRVYKPFLKIDFLLKKMMQDSRMPLEYFEDYKDVKLNTSSLNKHMLKENAAFRIPSGLCEVKTLF